MKKMTTLIAAMLMLGGSLFAQNYKAPETVDFYGVDYSQCRIYGATEGKIQFSSSLDGVNMLLITEQRKYDVGRFLGINEVNLIGKYIRDGKNAVLNEDPFIYDRKYTLSTEDIAAHIESLELELQQGTGLIFVAELLDKPNAVAYYHVVFFDIATRQVLSDEVKPGLPGGFGLRNYWAGSVMDMMKNYKKR